MPERALKKLLNGNERFVNQDFEAKDFYEQIKATSDGQSPFAAVLTCIDSRVSPELIFDVGIGDIFTVRVAGNVVNEDVLGSLEYACKVTGSKLILVLGHTKCGAVNAAIKGVEMGNITPMLKKIKPAIEKAKADGAQGKELESQTLTNNVYGMMEYIRTNSPILQDLEEQGMIKIVGALYDVTNGKVRLLDKQNVSLPVGE